MGGEIFVSAVRLGDIHEETRVFSWLLILFIVRRGIRRAWDLKEWTEAPPS